ncbi:MAG: alpha/beta hydrolase [Algicola sp.]|nr:alpha/beta hydrolase [Algicola sp.]
MIKTMITLLLTFYVVAAGAAETINIATAYNIESKVLKETRGYSVYLPDDYEQTKAWRFPVLYVLDGEDNLRHTSGTVDFLGRYNNIPGLIVIAIDSPERYRDFTPSGPEDDNTVGGAGPFLDFVEKELMPHINKTYRSDKFNMIAGHSLGGLLVIHSLQARPHLFQAHFAFSPSLWWDEQLPVNNMVKWLAKTKSTKNYLYLNLGDEGERMQAGYNDLVAALNKSVPDGFRFKAERLSDETHTTTPVIGQFSALRSLYAKWKIPNSYYPQGIVAIDQYYQALSKEFGYEIKTSQTVINNLAYYYMGYAKKPKMAIEAFSRNVQDYPDSGLAHANLAGGYENDGQIDKAIESFDRALKYMRESDASYVETKNNRDRLVKG